MSLSLGGVEKVDRLILGGCPRSKRDSLYETFETFPNNKVVYTSVVTSLCPLFFLVLLYRGGFLVLLRDH